MKKKCAKCMKMNYKKGGEKLKKEVKAGKKEEKVASVMEEYKEGKLHSGSKKGPKVKSRKQALAIALQESKNIKKKKKKK